MRLPYSFKLLLIGIFSSFSSLSIAQNEPVWSISTNDNYQFGSMMDMDSDGNIIVTGFIPAYLFNAHIYTNKYTPNGEVLWSVQSPSIDGNNYERSSWLEVDSQNNIYIIGSRYTGTSSSYTNSIIVIKYNSAGQLQWKKVIPHSLQSSLPIRGALDSNENLVIGTIGVDFGFVFIKLDSEGNEIITSSDATSSNQSFSSMRLKNDLVVMVSPAMNGTKASIAAFDTDGVYLWSHLLETNGAFDVEITDDNQIFLLSRKLNQVPNSTNYDVNILEFDQDGNQLNTFSYDFSNTNDFPSRMVYKDGRISIIGSIIEANESYMDWNTFQIDTEGQLLWSAKYDEMLSNDERPAWITALSNGDVFVSGQGGPAYNSPTGSQYMQFVVLRYSNGELIWSDTDIYQGYVGVHSLVDESCNLYVLGETAATVNFYEDDCGIPNSIFEEEIPSQTSLSIFPNPAIDEVNIKLPIAESTVEKIRIFNSTGSLVFESNNILFNPSQSVTFQLPELSNGIYNLVVASKSTKLFIQ